MLKPSALSLSIFVLLGLSAGMGLSACANQTTSSSEHADASAHDDTSSTQAPSARETLTIIPASVGLDSENNQRAQVFYLLMQAELAGQRGNVAEAGRLYLQAAKQGRDPRTAERATKIALLARDIETSNQALGLWVELEPQNDTRWPMEVLAAVRQQNDALALQLIIQNMPAKADARKESYQQLLTLLIHEGQGILPLLHQLAQTQANDAEAWFTLAQAALNFKDYDTARAALRKTIHLDPTRKEAYLLLADSYFSQKDMTAGVDVLRDMVQQFPNDQRLRLTYARALHEAGRTQEARDLLSKMLQKTPKDQDLRYAVALMALESGDDTTAERELKTLYRQKDRATNAAYYLGRLEEQRGQMDAAMRWYEQTQNSEFATEALLRMAQIDMLAGRLPQAQSRLAQARALSATDEERVRFYLLEVQILRQAERLQEAYALTNQALLEIQGEPDLLYSRALIAEQLGLFAESEADLRAILVQDPQNPEALNALGFTLAERNIKLDEAYALISQSLKLDPKSAATMDSMGWVLFRMGKLSEAESYLRQAFAINQDAEIAGHLTEVLAAQQRRDEARQLLDEALKRDPQDQYLLKLDARLRAEKPQ
ncbi:MAG: tetratricopeptide repeat protein [Halothiobacillaceae bacterium]|nr:tetratricopeptide repeat protein [Halothiobacillaceae bacterium]